MNMRTNGRNAQGEVLPKFNLMDLPDNVQHGTIFPVVTLDKWRHGWRIRHPQAVTHVGKSVSLSPISGTLPGIYPVLGAWVGSQRKRPHCACLREHCLAATRSALRQLHVGITKMIFTFLIAPRAPAGWQTCAVSAPLPPLLTPKPKPVSLWLACLWYSCPALRLGGPRHENDQAEEPRVFGRTGRPLHAPCAPHSGWQAGYGDTDQPA